MPCLGVNTKFGSVKVLFAIYMVIVSTIILEATFSNDFHERNSIPVDDKNIHI